MQAKLNYFKCQKCLHEWIPRIKDVRVCPKCHSYRWDQPKKETKDA